MTPNYDVLEPTGQALPLLFDSPHSGTRKPSDWSPIANHAQLATSWDAFVDELFEAAPRHGAALLRAHFPRAFIDLNRARDDIDPDMVSGTLSFPAQPTHKSAVGMGVLRRYALPEVPVYGAPILASQVEYWLQTYYDPYHAELRKRIEALHERFGCVRHIDCHSMKSIGNAMNDDAGQKRPDFVISDQDGKTSDPAFTAFVAGAFDDLGYSVSINHPYKGAHLVAAYSDPGRNIYSVQIEINRAIYMDEASLEKLPDFDTVQHDIGQAIRKIAMLLRGGADA